MSRTTLNVSPSRCLPNVTLSSSSVVLRHPVLVDSGSDASFIDFELAKKLNLETFPLPRPMEASALDGRLLCRVTHHTQPLQLSFQDGHTELLVFHVFRSPEHPIILGYPWLTLHNPHIDWSTGKIIAWCKGCLSTCSLTAPPAVPVIQDMSDPDYPDISKVPQCYHDLKEVFNKARATSLPPHRVYDCAIDLLPSSSPPRGRLYSLSAPETRAMKEYVRSLHLPLD